MYKHAKEGHHSVILLMAEIRRAPVEVGSLSHYLQGFSTIPGGDRPISEPSTVPVGQLKAFKTSTKPQVRDGLGRARQGDQKAAIERCQSRKIDESQAKVNSDSLNGTRFFDGRKIKAFY